MTYPKKKIIILSIIILFLFLCPFLIYFILQITLNTELPLVVVISDSMEPTIYKGDLLFVKGVNPNDIKNGTIEEKNGDIIVFNVNGLWERAPNYPIVHRVINKYQKGDIWYFRTKGDANLYPDPIDISQYHIYGIIYGRIPYIGWIKIFLTELNLFILLFVVISILLITSIVWDLLKNKNKKKYKDSKNQKDKLTNI